jgi:hypothetical protein
MRIGLYYLYGSILSRYPPKDGSPSVRTPTPDTFLAKDGTNDSDDKFFQVIGMGGIETAISYSQRSRVAMAARTSHPGSRPDKTHF